MFAAESSPLSAAVLFLGPDLGMKLVSPRLAPDWHQATADLMQIRGDTADQETPANFDESTDGTVSKLPPGGYPAGAWHEGGHGPRRRQVRYGQPFPLVLIVQR